MSELYWLFNIDSGIAVYEITPHTWVVSPIYIYPKQPGALVELLLNVTVRTLRLPPVCSGRFSTPQKTAIPQMQRVEGKNKPPQGADFLGKKHTK